MLERTAVEIKKVKGADRKEALSRLLTAANLPSSFSLALDPRIEFRGIDIEKSRFMDSKKLPLWITLQNVDAVAPDIPLMFKHGDDLRQDMLTLQMIRIMDRVISLQYYRKRCDAELTQSCGKRINWILNCLHTDACVQVKKLV